MNTLLAVGKVAFYPSSVGEMGVIISWLVCARDPAAVCFVCLLPTAFMCSNGWLGAMANQKAISATVVEVGVGVTCHKPHSIWENKPQRPTRSYYNGTKLKAPTVGGSRAVLLGGDGW